MTLLITIGTLSSFWAVLFLLDQLIRRYRPWKSAYLQRLEDCGLSLSFAHVKCYTTKFNKFFHTIGNSSRTACRLWFGLGVLTGVLLMITSVAVLMYTLFQFIFSKVSEDGTHSHQVLTPVMPGVNLPWNDIAYYLFTLTVCGVFHEAGHALAASTEQVTVTGFGVFVLFLYPGAFVDLHSDHLSVISPKRQLRIYCAGVWHNTILVLCALGLLWCMPYILSPLYMSGIGAVVTSLPEDSVLAGKIRPGSVITRVNSCLVTTDEGWYSCIMDIANRPQRGYCVPNEMLTGREAYGVNETTVANDGTIECCKEHLDSDICFHIFYSKGRHSQYKCLTARAVSAREMCGSSRDCHGVYEYACVFPAISSPSKLIRISHTEDKDVLFLGDPSALPYIVSTSSFVPRVSVAPLWLPGLMKTLCTYFISLSSALALLNMVPAYFLDGQWTLSVLMELYFEKKIPDAHKRHFILNCVLIFGSVLLGLNICLGIWTLINW